MNKQQFIKEIPKYYHLPLNLVSQKMKISISTVKKFCRSIGITRWPYRQISKINHELNKLKVMIDDHNIPQSEKDQMILQFNNLISQKQHIISNCQKTNSFHSTKNTINFNETKNVIQMNLNDNHLNQSFLSLSSITLSSFHGLFSSLLSNNSNHQQLLMK